ncbi:MAG: hypothetical protein J3Q66DRAFT_338111, partial [Benniella sp.]
RQDLLGQLYTNVAPSLINRFKEREETVRVEILQTLTLMVEQSKRLTRTLKASPRGAKEAVLEPPSRQIKSGVSF